LRRKDAGKKRTVLERMNANLQKVGTPCNPTFKVRGTRARVWNGSATVTHLKKQGRQKSPDMVSR